MPITPINIAKNAITPDSSNKASYALWGDEVVTWGDSAFGWGSPYFTFSNVSKNAITPTNQTKS